MRSRLIFIGLPLLAIASSAQERGRPFGPANEMVSIAAGRFLMGSLSSEVGRESNEAQHPVSVAAFDLDRTEVTNAQFRRFLLAHPEWQKDKAGPAVRNETYLQDWSGTDFPAGKDHHPAGFVSWFAARAYCASLGKRLPTEAEWEYAARAGTSSAYWWGNSFAPSRAVSLGSNSTQPVGDPTRINPWGLADISGNVWEWTSTLHKPYPYRADDGREGAGSGSRVARGGAFDNGSAEQRSAYRGYDHPDNAGDCVGFRCAR